MNATKRQEADSLGLSNCNRRTSWSYGGSSLCNSGHTAGCEDVAVSQQPINEMCRNNASLGMARNENYVGSVKVLHPIVIRKQVVMNPE